MTNSMLEIKRGNNKSHISLLFIQQKEYPIQLKDNNQLNQHQYLQQFVQIYDLNQPKISCFFLYLK